MANKSKIIIIIAAVAVLAIAAGIGFGYWRKKGGVAEKFSPAEVEASLGGKIFEKIQNPFAGKLPPTNPFENATTNPLKDVYQNPF